MDGTIPTHFFNLDPSRRMNGRGRGREGPASEGISFSICLFYYHLHLRTDRDAARSNNELVPVTSDI